MPGNTFHILASMPDASGSNTGHQSNRRTSARRKDEQALASHEYNRGGRGRGGSGGNSRGQGRAGAKAGRVSGPGRGASAVRSDARAPGAPANGGPARGKANQPRGQSSLPKWSAPAQTVVVADPVAVGPAVRVLAQESRIAVDCEGVALSRTGALCLVQVASNKAVYIFDIAVGGRALFDAGLRELLQSEKCLKVLHDCRHDCDAMLWQYDVRLGPVLDTQVAFSVLREVRNMKVGLPVSLKTLLLKFVGVSDEELTVKDGIKSLMREQENFWLERPLPPDALQYARFDVVYLLHVAKVLAIHITSAVGSKDERGWKRVLKESEAYAALFRDNEDGPRKENARWARMVTEAKAEQAIRDRQKAAKELSQVDPMRSFKFDREPLLGCVDAVVAS